MAASLDYAQARVQARYGQRPDRLLWQELHGIKDFAAFLEAARGSALQPWLGGFDAESTGSEIELGLRAALRTRIGEVAGWMPQPWQATVHWTARLLDLPAIFHLARGEMPPEWMRRDPCLGRYPDLDALLDSEWRPVVLAWQRGVSMRTAWLGEWRRRWPARDPSLERLVELIEAHLARFTTGPPQAAWGLREALQRELRWLFRRSALAPAAAFVYLASVALDLERLRGELLGRLRFPEAERAP